MSPFVSVMLALAGIVCIGVGFDLSHRLKNPWQVLAAVLAPVGVLMAAAGAVSLLVPNFF